MENPLHKHGQFFDVWSRFYRLGLFGLELRRIQRQAIARLRLAPSHRVLDLGCGPADGTALIAKSGALTFGLDYSDGMLAKARRARRCPGHLVRGDAGRLPFKDGALDRVICTNSFHHYPDHPGALREIRRVLRPGGLLVLVDPRRDHLFGWLAIDVIERRLFGLTEVRIYSPEEWTKLLADAGFSHSHTDFGPPIQLAARAELFIEATA